MANSIHDTFFELAGMFRCIMCKKNLIRDETQDVFACKEVAHHTFCGACVKSLLHHDDEKDTEFYRDMKQTSDREFHLRISSRTDKDHNGGPCRIFCVNDLNPANRSMTKQVFELLRTTNEEMQEQETKKQCHLCKQRVDNNVLMEKDGFRMWVCVHDACDRIIKSWRPRRSTARLLTTGADV